MTRVLRQAADMSYSVTLPKNSIVVCELGTTIPLSLATICERPQCPILRSNASTSFHFNNSMAIARCNKGYTSNSSDVLMLTCAPAFVQGSSFSDVKFEWNGNKGSFCRPMTCPGPEPVINGHYLQNGRPEITDWTFGSTISIQCNSGTYLRTADRHRECTENGQWSGENPLCTGQWNDIFDLCYGLCSICNFQWQGECGSSFRLVKRNY